MSAFNNTGTYINEYHNTWYGGLERTDFNSFYFRGCGGLERTDF